MKTSKTEKQENGLIFNEITLGDLINCPTINVGGTGIKVLLKIIDDEENL